MFSSMQGFFRNPWNTLPKPNPLEPLLGSFSSTSLELCENGQEIENDLKTACSPAMDTVSFRKWVSSVSFNPEKELGFSSKLNILFTVIQSGDIKKLEALRDLPQYDQIPLNFQDSKTGKTTISACGSFEMYTCVVQIIRLQHLERAGGAKLLAENGYYQYASGISIIPHLKDGSREKELAEEALERDERMCDAISRILNP